MGVFTQVAHNIKGFLLANLQANLLTRPVWTGPLGSDFQFYSPSWNLNPFLALRLVTEEKMEALPRQKRLGVLKSNNSNIMVHPSSDPDQKPDSASGHWRQLVPDKYSEESLYVHLTFSDCSRAATGQLWSLRACPTPQQPALKLSFWRERCQVDLMCNQQ